MDLDRLDGEARKSLQDAIGYLNFSSGAADPKFLRAVNSLFARIATREPPAEQPPWRALAGLLRRGLEELRQRSDVFRQADQAAAVLHLVFDETLPAYLRFHRDLLFHQTEASLFQPFFLGRVCEAVLAMGGPWHQRERIVAGAVRRLNDFIGYRPVAVLRTTQKMQPYEHEWVGPIPLYVREAGVAWGPYREVIALALEILHATEPDLLQQAWFQPEHLDELSLDPRAYDFDHPVNRRPNHHFGMWDLHRIDNRGYYRRFVLQQVTLDGLCSRIGQRTDLPREELRFEAAAVLACTMLMGSGVTGDGPEALDSSMTLAKLVVRIAAYRDAFYERLIGRLSGPHAERLRAEAERLRQPFGGARQHLNQSLAGRRARQLQHVHLARLFARMGYAEAAGQQARVVPVASARMRCEIDCRLSAAHQAVDQGRLAEAASLVPQIEDWLHRAIACGAIVDPWNILGFGGQFSRSPAVEDSVHDERIDDLVELLGEIFALYARLKSKAAAASDGPLGERLSEGMKALGQWWDKFASPEVASVHGFSGYEAWQSASQVAGALGAWHRAGTAAGDVAFWREHVEEFCSPKAYALLAEALLEQRDLVAAMALLVHWLSQAEEIGLAEGPHAFHALAIRWLEAIWAQSESAEAMAVSGPDRRWAATRRFLDFLEANAESYWQVPQLEVGGQSLARGSTRFESAQEEGSSEDLDRFAEELGAAADELEEAMAEEDEEESEDLFSAAYENVVYRDSAEDGFEGEMIESAAPISDFELAHELERISQRLAFLGTVGRLWKTAAAASAGAEIPAAERDEALASWGALAARWRQELEGLLAVVHGYRIPAPGGTHESLVQYDQQRAIKDTLLERIVAAAVEAADTARLLPALTEREPPGRRRATWETLALRMLRALYRGQTDFARGLWPRLRQALRGQPLLYLPLARGGNPLHIARSRALQQLLRRLLAGFPRAGLIRETGELLDTIQRMEWEHPVGPSAVTEFDRLFEVAVRGVLGCLIASSEEWEPPSGRSAARPHAAAPPLLEVLERQVEVLLKRWLAHSRNVRVSVLEAVADETRWKQLCRFIERYGPDLFTQRFLTYGNVRAILHQGADQYLRTLEEESDEEAKPRLIEELDGPISRGEAGRWLELCLEAVAENYAEYLDYNSTTTQSDRGGLLYVLLDFLRLQARYDRVAWNLKPVLLAHEVLIQSGRMEAARRWRQAVAERTAGEADEHLRRLEKLVARYGVRLRSVDDRLRQRFVQPLAVDRLCALVQPAVEELRGAQERVSFATLEKELESFTAEPGGVGFDLPPWLEALQAEVHRVQSEAEEEEEEEEEEGESALIGPTVPQIRLTVEELQNQIDAWEHGIR